MRNTRLSSFVFASGILLNTGCHKIHFEADKTDAGETDNDTADSVTGSSSDSDIDKSQDTDAAGSRDSDKSRDTTAIGDSDGGSENPSETGGDFWPYGTDRDTDFEIDIGAGNTDPSDTPANCTPDFLGNTFPKSALTEVHASWTEAIDNAIKLNVDFKGFGFYSIDEVERRSLGEPYKMIPVEFVTTANGDIEAKLNMNLYGSTNYYDYWTFPLMVDGTVRCEMDGTYSSGEWEQMGFGIARGAALPSQWTQEIQKLIDTRNFDCALTLLVVDKDDFPSEHLLINHDDGTARVYPSEGLSPECANYTRGNLNECSFALEDFLEYVAQ